ncbi:trypsin inhibitor-like [Leguminivora glycinivorella]|uniref:trypsin inhibitor-like n=1 Tax=Leguminivora glycinivorella TaxID=1035111 RepID=UPI00200FB213|nr:trypsin inhibitor-like [Leguminivora glycinivorella]
MLFKIIFCLLILGRLFDEILSDGNVCYRDLVEPGPCKGKFPRYGYDKKLGRCRKFYWGGCEDNGNNFKCLSECIDTCETRCD